MSYKTTRANKMVSRNGQPRSGHCLECGRMTSEALGGKRVTIPAQKNGVWLCCDHRGKRNLRAYGDENRETVGTPTTDGISISAELESMGYSSHARAYLLYNKFIPTYDSTVDIERLPVYMRNSYTESRSIRREGSSTRFGRVLSPRTRSVMIRAAAMPISTVGTSIVVRGGLAYWLISILLIPMTANSSGTRMPS